MKFLDWAISSLIGHIVLVGGAFFLIMSTLFLVLNYIYGTLTVTHAVRILVAGLLLGIVAAITLWYAVTLPIRRRLGGNSGDGSDGKRT
jgi:hypothetical protein